MFIYFWDSTRVGGDEIGFEAGSALTAASEPSVGLELTNREIMTWAEVRHSTDWATQAPKNTFI